MSESSVMVEKRSGAKRASRRRVWWRRALQVLGVGCVTLAVLLAVGLVLAWEAMGTAPEGARLERMQRSPQWRDGVFENPQPLYNDTWGALTSVFDASDNAVPREPLPVIDVDPTLFDTPPASGLRITWLGHSTLILEVDGVRLLTDPVWGPRASPLSFIGPERWYPPPLALEDLPSIDAVLISHDHYDHLDHPTIVALKDKGIPLIAPLGVGAHLEYWGVPAEHIVEMDWWETTDIKGLKIHCTPSRHASGRHLLDQNRTLWASYAIVGPDHRVFFSGDTGMFPALKEIGDTLGPFDVTMVEAGAYHKSWPDWHMGPEQAVEAHQWLKGEVYIPIHWGLFRLAPHGWTEPVERSMAAAERAGVRILVPRPGESLEPATATTERWWPEVPWDTADEHPIRATKLE